MIKRRQVLRQLLQTSGGLIGASLLGGCSPRSFAALFPLELLDPDIPLPAHLLTPLREFYVQSYALAAHVDRDTWQLKIKGAVTHPLTLSFADILAAPQENFYLTMECIGNPKGGNLIGNAHWMGTPLLPFLEKAGVQPQATEFRLQGADWYETTLPVTEVMRPEVRLVHRMNGEPLTAEHGYPLRIIIPGHFGQKQPKWLVGIEASPQAKRGFWEHQGWSNTAEIPTHALVRQVQNRRVWNQQHRVRYESGGEQDWRQGILVAGVALDRSSPIQQIEISINGGQTWVQAEQNSPSSAHEWTLWRYRWQPSQPGQYTLLARAISARQGQNLEDVNYRDGNTAPLQIQITLAA